MKRPIEPVAPELILNELTPERFLRKTNNGNREIYIITHHNSPHTMREIGRLREISFRTAGGGTGEEIDIDEFDTSDIPYKQLIVWNPDDMEIVGGYRYISGKEIKIDEKGVHSATGHLFRFSDTFINDYLPYTIELGRSFVQPFYQPSYNIKRGMYSLDNLWDGLGAIIVDHPEMKYFFGKITMYPSFNDTARNFILSFLQLYFPDNENLVYPFNPLELDLGNPGIKKAFKGNNYQDDYKSLVQNVRANGENIPPLVNAYMNLSPTMKTFGTAINHEFGRVEETGILITIPDIFEMKKERHVQTYKHSSEFRIL